MNYFYCFLAGLVVGAGAMGVYGTKAVATVKDDIAKIKGKLGL